MSEGQPVFADPRLHDGSTSTGELASRLAEQVSRLARDEIGLAQRQLAQKGRQARLGAGAFGVAAVAAFYAGGALQVAAGLALSYVVAGWAAAVIVGVVLLLIAGIAALVGRSALRRVTPIPTESIESVRADLQTVKESVRK